MIRTPMTAGEKHGRLTAIEFEDRTHDGRKRWRFRCDCGNEVVSVISNVRRGNTTSCGCRREEIWRSASGQIKHGMSNSPEWKSWRAMWERCTRQAHEAFHLYGGSGVTVCERWKEFENFYADMGPRPHGASLDRFPNKAGNYEPGNVRWASSKMQNRNKRTTRIVEYRGASVPLASAAEAAGIALQRVKARLRNGWTIDQALEAPVDARFSRPQKQSAGRHR